MSEEQFEEYFDGEYFDFEKYINRKADDLTTILIFEDEFSDPILKFFIGLALGSRFCKGMKKTIDRFEKDFPFSDVSKSILMDILNKYKEIDTLVGKLKTTVFKKNIRNEIGVKDE